MKDDIKKLMPQYSKRQIIGLRILLCFSVAYALFFVSSFLGEKWLEDKTELTRIGIFEGDCESLRLQFLDIRFTDARISKVLGWQALFNLVPNCQALGNYTYHCVCKDGRINLTSASRLDIKNFGFRIGIR